MLHVAQSQPCLLLIIFVLVQINTLTRIWKPMVLAQLKTDRLVSNCKQRPQIEIVNRSRTQLGIASQLRSISMSMLHTCNVGNYFVNGGCRKNDSFLRFIEFIHLLTHPIFRSFVRSCFNGRIQVSEWRWSIWHKFRVHANSNLAERREGKLPNFERNWITLVDMSQATSSSDNSSQRKRATRRIEKSILWKVVEFTNINHAYLNLISSRSCLGLTRPKRRRRRRRRRRKKLALLTDWLTDWLTGAWVQVVAGWDITFWKYIWSTFALEIDMKNRKLIPSELWRFSWSVNVRVLSLVGEDRARLSSKLSVLFSWWRLFEEDFD